MGKLKQEDHHKFAVSLGFRTRSRPHSIALPPKNIKNKTNHNSTKSLCKYWLFP